MGTTGEADIQGKYFPGKKNTAERDMLVSSPLSLAANLYFKMTNQVTYLSLLSNKHMMNAYLAGVRDGVSMPAERIMPAALMSPYGQDT